MSVEVGSHQATIRLAELLQGVQAGKRYTITLRGAGAGRRRQASGCPGGRGGDPSIDARSAARKGDRLKVLINAGRA